MSSRSAIVRIARLWLCCRRQRRGHRSGRWEAEGSSLRYRATASTDLKIHKQLASWPNRAFRREECRIGRSLRSPSFSGCSPSCLISSSFRFLAIPGFRAGLLRLRVRRGCPSTPRLVMSVPVVLCASHWADFATRAVRETRRCPQSGSASARSVQGAALSRINRLQCVSRLQLHRYSAC